MSTACIVIALVTLGQADPQVFYQNVRQTEPQSARNQLGEFHVPEGFQVQLVASEPDLQKPMNLAFDAAGRLWVTTSEEYPFAAEGDVGRDRICVLEIDQQTGNAFRVTRFADDLNIPMGIYPFQDGCVVYSVPRILKLLDTDGDGVADQRSTLIDGMGRPRDTHGMQNAFRRGLDGWLYINHGFANDTVLTGSDQSRLELNSGNVYRIRLDGSRVESFSWGKSTRLVATGQTAAT